MVTASHYRRNFDVSPVLAFVIATLLILCISIMAKGPNIEGKPYIVAYGDTVWDIGQRLFPKEDGRKVTDAIMYLNPSLQVGLLKEGQVIQVPKSL